MSSQRLLNYVLSLFIFLFCNFSILSAQDTGDDNQVAFDSEGWKLQNNVVPPSPEAASLGNYGNLPINYYTGSVNVSIPLGGIGGQQLSVPFSLNYDASSVKVATMPSSVGLGWSLSAGGVITRAVQGMPDTYNYFDWRTDPLYSEYDIYFDDDGDECQNEFLRRRFLRHINIGDIDIQPDVFYFNFPGGSGSFIFDYRSKQVIQRDESDLIILPEFTGDDDINGFTVKTLNGVEYRFGYDTQSTEYTRVRSPYYDNPGGNPDVNDVPNEPEKWHEYNSSWYLISITSADGAERIELDYQDVVENESTPGGDDYYRVPINPYNAESVSLRQSGIGYPPTWLGSPTGYDPQAFAGQIPQIYNRSFLQQVRFYLADQLIQSADFTVETIAEDFESPKSSGVKMTNILFKSRWQNGVLDMVNTMDYQLSYDINTHNRLVLSTVVERGYHDGAIAVTKPPYVCTYGDGTLPSATSNAIDFWGYYNGATSNDRLIPDFYLDGNLAFDGANRKASLRETGVLKTITYPTGGSTSFSYQLHEAGNVPTDGDYLLNYGNKIGGLRISSITDDPGDEPAVTRRFRYLSESGQSSGALLEQPNYARISTYWIFRNAEGCFHPCPPGVYLNDADPVDNVAIFAYNASSFGSVQGSHIGYSRVEEIIGSEGGIGKNVYHYYNGGSEYWSTTNGKLQKKEVFDANANPVRDEVYHYKDETLDRYYIYKTEAQSDQDNREILCLIADPFDEGIDYSTACETPGVDFHFEWRVTSVASSDYIYDPAECDVSERFTRKLKFTTAKTASTRLFMVDSVTVTDYFPGGNVEQLTTNEYEHNRYPTLLTASQRNNSDGTLYRTEIEYTSRPGIGILARPEIIRQAESGSAFGGTRRVYDDLGHVLEIYELVEGGEEVLRASITGYNTAAQPGAYQFMNFPKEIFNWDNSLLTQRTYGTGADSWTWNYDYDERRQLVYQQDIDGQEVNYTYDGLGRLRRIGQREENVITGIIYTLGGENSIEKRTTYPDAPAQTVTNYFDGLGRPTKTDVNDVTKQEQFYDEFGRLVRQTYLPGGTYTDLYYQDNPLNRLIEEFYPDGNRVEYRYDAEDNYYTQERINERSFSTTTTIDLLGRLKQTEDAIEGITSYTYDPRGNILTIGSPAGAYAYAYDQRFRLVSKTVPGAGAMTYCYDDANDLLCRSRDGNGNQLSTVYDEYGRELEVYHQITASDSDCDCTTGGTQVISNQYDQGGAIYTGKLNRSVVKMVGASGRVITDYTLDDFGRVDFETQDVIVDGTSFDYNIDPKLNHADWLVSNNYQVASTQNFAGSYNETFAYDDFGRVTMHAAGGLTTRMRYNDADQVLYKIYDDNLQRQDYQYNIRGWLTDINIARPEVLRQSDISDTDPSLCEPQTGDDDSYVSTELVPPSEFFELLCSGQDVIIPGLDTCVVVYPPEEECVQILKDYTLSWKEHEHSKAADEACSKYKDDAVDYGFAPLNIDRIYINNGSGISTAPLSYPYSINRGLPTVEDQRLIDDLSNWLLSIDTLSYPFDSIYVTRPGRGDFKLHVTGTSFVSFLSAEISASGGCCDFDLPSCYQTGQEEGYLGEATFNVQKYFTKTFNRREACRAEETAGPVPGGGSGTFQPQVPTIFHEVILSDGRKEWYFTDEIATISGAYTISKQIRIDNANATFTAKDANGTQQTNLSISDILTLRTTQSGLFEVILQEEGVGPTIECPPAPPGCDEATAAQQQESLEQICANTIEALQNGTLTPPYNIALVQLCDGSYTYVQADQLTNIYGGYNVLDEITIESDEDLITVQIRNEEMRFAMHFAHQPNGNIERMKWKISNRATDIYDLVYDPLDRVTEANYAQEYYWEEVQNAGTSNEYVSRDYVFADYAQTYNTAYTYDGGGNIMTLWRNGLGSSCLGPGGRIDDLTYTYGGLGGKQLIGVADAAPANLRPYGFKPYGSPFPGDLTYTYDLNGNMTHDPHKELDFVYNFLNLPEQVNGPGTEMKVIYDASGRKWKKESAYKDDDGNTISKTTLYAGAFEFEETPEHSLRLATTNAHEDGRVVKLWDQPVNGDVPDRLEYYHKDHLGNVRLTFSDLNQDGAITVGSIYDPLNEIVFEKHYYPFGMDMTGAWFATVAPDNSYTYNSKEWNESIGLLDYATRLYDPAIARFTGVDPISDQFAWVSPYNYAENSPVGNIDLWGLQKYFAADGRLLGQIGSSNRVRVVANNDAGLANSYIKAANETNDKVAMDSAVREHYRTEANNLSCGLGMTDKELYLRVALSTVRTTEGHGNPTAYNSQYGNRTFSDYSKHPDESITRWGHTSSAAGAYQFLGFVWDEVSDAIGVNDFSPESQDQAAIFRIETKRSRGYNSIISGKLEEGISRLSGEWTSLPGGVHEWKSTITAIIKGYLIQELNGNSIIKSPPGSLDKE